MDLPEHCAKRSDHTLAWFPPFHLHEGMSYRWPLSLCWVYKKVQCCQTAKCIFSHPWSQTIVRICHFCNCLFHHNPIVLFMFPLFLCHSFVAPLCSPFKNRCQLYLSWSWAQFIQFRLTLKSFLPPLTRVQCCFSDNSWIWIRATIRTWGETAGFSKHQGLLSPVCLLVWVSGGVGLTPDPVLWQRSEDRFWLLRFWVYSWGWDKGPGL